MNDLRTHLYRALRYDMAGCGCNQPEAADRLVLDLLQLAPLHKDEGWRKARELIGSDGAFQIVLGALTEADLLEHGSTLGGSWLTERGRWVLWAVEQIGGVDQLETVLDESGLPHDGEDCVTACWQLPDDQRDTAGTPVTVTDEQRLTKFQEDRDAARRIQQDLTERWWGFAWPPREPSTTPAPVGRQRFNQQTGQWEAVG